VPVNTASAPSNASASVCSTQLHTQAEPWLARTMKAEARFAGPMLKSEKSAGLLKAHAILYSQVTTLHDRLTAPFDAQSTAREA
jgi:hypothetical protein